MVSLPKWASLLLLIGALGGSQRATGQELRNRERALSLSLPLSLSLLLGIVNLLRFLQVLYEYRARYFRIITVSTIAASIPFNGT